MEFLVTTLGYVALYKGIDAAVMRQFIYCGARLGLYKYIEDHYKEHEKRNLTFLEKTLASLVTGAIGSAIANPTDVALIRFQADNSLPPEKRRNYKNVIDALLRIHREEGVRGLWTGATPTIFRAMSVNSSQLVSYNQTKEMLQAYLNTEGEPVSIRLLSSALSGVAVTVFSLPFDNVKTKIMRMKKSTRAS